MECYEYTISKKLCTQHQSLNAELHYVHGFKTLILLPVELWGFAVVFRYFAFIIGGFLDQHRVLKRNVCSRSVKSSTVNVKRLQLLFFKTLNNTSQTEPNQLSACKRSTMNYTQHIFDNIIPHVCIAGCLIC